MIEYSVIAEVAATQETQITPLIYSGADHYSSLGFRKIEQPPQELIDGVKNKLFP